MTRLHRRRGIKHWLVLLALACTTSIAVAQSDAAPEQPLTLPGADNPAIVAVLRDAQQRLAQQDATGAYDLLMRHELEWSGAAPYDYLLGMAALDSKRSREAAFALERVIAAQPEFDGARIELARAYFESGDLPAARTQFAYLQRRNPPARTAAVIARYLEAINSRSTLAGSRWSRLLQFGSGYDSNANGSTADTEFLGFTLSPRNVEAASGFAELVAGLGHTIATGARSGIASNLQISHRAYPDASYVDQTVVSLGSAAIWQFGATRITAGVNGQYGLLDGQDHDWSANVDLALTRRTDSNWDWSGSLRSGLQRYRDDRLHVLDAERTLVGIAATRINLGEGNGRMGVALLAGRDKARQSGSPYGNDKLGARAFVSWLLRPQSSLYAEISGLRSDFNNGGFFGIAREDKQYGAVLALELQNWPAARWSVSPRLRYTRNDSNVSLYQYDRAEIAVFVRRAF